MKAKILLNPYANRWRAKAQVPLIRAACDAAGLDYDLTAIPAAGQGKQVTIRALADGYDAIVAAGGDGTVSEVANGLIAVAGDKPTQPLGVMPIGTGNDFNDMSELPRDLKRAAQIIAAGKTRQVDAGQVVADGVIHYFDNNCALAMEPMVTIENLQMKRLSGNIRYVVAVVKALAKLSAWQMHVSWEDGEYKGPVYLLSVCNGPRTGGLFPMAPNAKMDDGYFDFVIAPEVPKLTVLSILARLFRGTHIHHPRITHGRATHLTVESRPGTPIHADGEVISRAAARISYEVLPGKLTLIIP